MRRREFITLLRGAAASAANPECAPDTRLARSRRCGLRCSRPHRGPCETRAADQRLGRETRCSGTRPPAAPQRPHGRRAAEQRDEMAAMDHSITSSARASSDVGTLSPSAFAVLRLMANSTLVTCYTGRSAAFSPLRMREV